MRKRQLNEQTERIIEAARERRRLCKEDHKFLSWDTVLWMVFVICEKILFLCNSIKSNLLAMRYQPCPVCEERRRKKQKRWFSYGNKNH